VSKAYRFETQAGTKTPFTLTQTIDGDTAKKPATFKYAHSVAKGTVASADFAVQYRRGETTFRHESIQKVAYLEGVLKSHAKDSDTALRPAVGLIHTMGHASFSLVTFGVLTHESDQSLHTRKLLADIDTTPSYDRWAMGTAYPRDLSTEPPVQFLWEPTFGVNLGRTLDAGDSTEINKSVERYSARIDTVFYLNRIGQMLNLPRLNLEISDKGWLLPREDKTHRNLFSASLTFPFADKVSVGLSFKHGQQPPEFKRTHDYGLTVGLQLAGK
jgi:hypothetical protein